MKPAALLAFVTDIRALGLETAQGLYLTTAWYWDLDDKSRAFAKRFLDKVGREPTFIQAAHYSATTTYLTAVKAAGTTDPDKVMDELHKMKISDMFTEDGFIRADGLMEHSMYVIQVKKPSESKYPWDYYRVVQKMSGEQAFGKLADFDMPADQEIDGRATCFRRYSGARRRSTSSFRSQGCDAWARPRISDGASGLTAHLAAVAQERVGEHAGDHRLADRHRPNADARVVPALGDDLGFFTGTGDGAARRQNR